MFKHSICFPMFQMFVFLCCFERIFIVLLFNNFKHMFLFTAYSKSTCFMFQCYFLCYERSRQKQTTTQKTGRHLGATSGLGCAMLCHLGDASEELASYRRARNLLVLFSDSTIRALCETIRFTIRNRACQESCRFPVKTKTRTC